jgi:hypothetical protein
VQALTNSSWSSLRTPAIHYIFCWPPLHRYGATYNWSHAASCCCMVWFVLLRLNVHLAWCYLWLQLQHRCGLPCVCVAAVSQQCAYLMKHPSFSRILIQSHGADVFVEPWIVVVEKVRKMTIKIGKS